jgi:hypothetical protein
VAAEVSKHLGALRQPLAQLATGEVEGGWEGVEEVADTVLHAARLVWPLRGPGGWALSQRRLQHWLQVVGAALCQHVQVRLRLQAGARTRSCSSSCSWLPMSALPAARSA